VNAQPNDVPPLVRSQVLGKMKAEPDNVHPWSRSYCRSPASGVGHHGWGVARIDAGGDQRQMKRRSSQTGFRRADSHSVDAPKEVEEVGLLQTPAIPEVPDAEHLVPFREGDGPVCLPLRVC